MKRYYITDRQAVGGLEPLLQIIREQIRQGVDLIQIREKDLEAQRLFDFTCAVVSARNEIASQGRWTQILVNTRTDVAVAASADGVHLPAAAPKATLSGLLISRSCHTLQEVMNAQADLVTFGPIFDTPHKGKGQGLAMLRAACQLGTPVYALGGITWSNADECVAAGAAGVAGIRLFQQAGAHHKPLH